MALAYKGPHQPPKPVDSGKLTHTNAPSRELEDTERGRVFQSASGARSAMERHTDPHEHEKKVFADEVASFLSDRHTEFDRLVLVSAPKMLGYLRKSLGAEVRSKISDEVSKDLTNEPVDQLPRLLSDVVYFE